MQLVTTAWIDLSNSIGLGSFQTDYLLYFMYEEKMTVVRIPSSRQDGFSALSQRDSFYSVQGSVNNEEGVDDAARNCQESAEHAMRRSTSKCFKHQDGLLKRNTLYTLEVDKLF